MSTKITTNDFKVMLAQELETTLKSLPVYMSAGHTAEWDSASNPDNVNTSVSYLDRDISRYGIFGKRITESDIALMIKNKLWEFNTIYAEFDDRDSELESKDFYTITLEGADYSVFKCISNAGGSNSTDSPKLSETSPNDNHYQTSDGYVWKLMTTIDGSTFDKFKTDEYVPLVANSQVSGNAVSGALDHYYVADSGENLNNFANVTIESTNVDGNPKKLYVKSANTTALSSNTNFYANTSLYITSGAAAGDLRTVTSSGVSGSNKFIMLDEALSTTPEVGSVAKLSPRVIIDGDGSGAVAICNINPVGNTVSSIDVISRGSGYNYANVIVTANTGDITGDTLPDIRAILSPPGGHGSNQASELFAQAVCMTSTFSANDHPQSNTSYRQISVIKNPAFTSLAMTIDDVSGFSNGEIVSQATTNATGTISGIDASNNILTLTSVVGVFEEGNTYLITGGTSNTESFVTAAPNVEIFDNRVVLEITPIYGTNFVPGETIVQGNTSATVHSVANNSIYLVDVINTFTISDSIPVSGSTSGVIGIITAIEEADIIPFSGDVLYVNNIEAITRGQDQSETIKIILDI